MFYNDYTKEYNEVHCIPQNQSLLDYQMQIIIINACQIDWTISGTCKNKKLRIR